VKLVHVQWRDSGIHVDKGWAGLDQYMANLSADSTLVDTVGILMHEDDDILMIGMSYDSFHDTWYGAQVILKSNIVDTYTLIPSYTMPQVKFIPVD